MSRLEFRVRSAIASKTFFHVRINSQKRDRDVCVALSKSFFRSSLFREGLGLCIWHAKTAAPLQCGGRASFHVRRKYNQGCQLLLLSGKSANAMLGFKANEVQQIIYKFVYCNSQSLKKIQALHESLMPNHLQEEWKLVALAGLLQIASGNVAAAPGKGQRRIRSASEMPRRWRCDITRKEKRWLRPCFLKRPRGRPLLKPFLSCS